MVWFTFAVKLSVPPPINPFGFFRSWCIS